MPNRTINQLRSDKRRLEADLNKALGTQRTTRHQALTVHETFNQKTPNGIRKKLEKVEKLILEASKPKRKIKMTVTPPPSNDQGQQQQGNNTDTNPNDNQGANRISPNTDNGKTAPSSTTDSTNPLGATSYTQPTYSGTIPTLQNTYSDLGSLFKIRNPGMPHFGTSLYGTYDSQKPNNWQRIAGHNLDTSRELATSIDPQQDAYFWQQMIQPNTQIDKELDRMKRNYEQIIQNQGIQLERGRRNLLEISMKQQTQANQAQLRGNTGEPTQQSAPIQNTQNINTGGGPPNNPFQNNLFQNNPPPQPPQPPRALFPMQYEYQMPQFGNNGPYLPMDNRPRNSYIQRLREIPIFEGDSHKTLRDFLDIVESLNEGWINEAEKTELIEAIGLKLRGEAKKAVGDLYELNFEQMKNKLLKHFSYLLNQDVIDSQLENIKQNEKETMSEYADRARKILKEKCSLYDYLTPQQKKDYERTARKAFAAGIQNAQLQKVVKQKGSSSLEEAIAFAIEMEYDTKNTIQKSELFCKYCRNNGHREIDCLHKKNNTGEIGQLVNALRSMNIINNRNFRNNPRNNSQNNWGNRQNWNNRQNFNRQNLNRQNWNYGQNSNGYNGQNTNNNSWNNRRNFNRQNWNSDQNSNNNWNNNNNRNNDQNPNWNNTQNGYNNRRNYNRNSGTENNMRNENWNTNNANNNNNGQNNNRGQRNQNQGQRNYQNNSIIQTVPLTDNEHTPNPQLESEN